MSGDHLSTRWAGGLYLGQETDAQDWPSPRRVWDVARPRSFRDFRTLAAAPWFHMDGYNVPALINRYISGGRLPGGLPGRCVSTWEWRNRVVLPLCDINRFRGREILEESEARADLVRVYYRGYSRMFPNLWVPSQVPFDTWYYRTSGERNYGPALQQIFEDHATAWAGKTSPMQEALVLNRRLPSEFKYIGRRDKWRLVGQRTNDSYWEHVRWERRFRSRTGFLTPYQLVGAERIASDARANRLVCIRDHEEWSRYEVAQGLWVPLPPVLTYLGSHMIWDPDSPVWLIFYTEWVAEVATVFLWEVYDRFRLWWLPVKSGRLF